MDNLNCAVIGAGRFGKHYIRLLGETKGMKLSAVDGRDNWKQVILDPNIDCVIIATPVSTHFLIAKAALEAGKHVLLEKPMVSTLAEAHKLQKVVKARRRVFLVGHQYLYNDYIRYLKKEVDGGKFGTGRYFFAEHLYPGPIRDDVGCFWETATHELAIIDYFFGQQKVVESGGRKTEIISRGRDDFSTAEIIFQRGLTASIVVSWLSPEKVRRFTLVGDRGVAVFDERARNQLKFYFFKNSPFSFKNAREVIPAINVKESLRNQLEHFRDCIWDKKIPLTDIRHGVRVTEMLDVVSKSLKVS